METFTLSEGKPGFRYRILKIADEERLLNRISSMGLIPGGTLYVCQNQKKQPVLIFARDTYRIRVIHGYNRGNSIQRAIYREIGHGLNPKVLRIVGGDNPGITELVLREY